jgi:hypothetical protein
MNFLQLLNRIEFNAIIHGQNFVEFNVDILILSTIIHAAIYLLDIEREYREYERKDLRVEKKS